ncbi:MAG: CHAT domain-containing protein [Oscillatoriales cyanobacterium RM2_1_1]|nr:CHAT domain-containing protein [Oscillatoriales cyanobacterium SM2_3_0]NJO45595.1 CHAT domain-containing protein [Oscillatoriales cyanobacterium RM2_1_1]
MIGILTAIAVVFLTGFSPNNPASINWNQKITQIERSWEAQYEDYFNHNLAEIRLDAEGISQTLKQAAQRTQTHPAVLWVIPESEGLNLILLTPGGSPVGKLIPAATMKNLLPMIQTLRAELTDPRRQNRIANLNSAQQLYQWIVQPFETVLAAEGIDTILFCTGPGLRTLPLAALHDGRQFLIERYSITRIPAFNLFNSEPASLKAAQVLAMGASEFQQQTPLPAVPIELNAIVHSGETQALDLESQWPGKRFLNQAFTLKNLQNQLASGSFQIVHLATHAEFKSGSPKNSYIQLWDDQLQLDQMDQINWQNPPAELLVLSACKTAIGDDTVELGFAGLALQAGVKSAVASLWYVSDTGTLALMSEFYRQLKTTSTKAEALRQAQIAMLSGKVRIEQNELLGSRGGVTLLPDLTEFRNEDFTHPFYWAGFSLIGSPW